MSTITTVSELRELPIGTVLTDRMSDVWMIDTYIGSSVKLCAPECASMLAEYVLRKWSPLTVQWRPDQPHRTESPIRAGALREVAKSAVLMEVGRKAVEDELIEWRDSRRFSLRRNGYVIRESDGSASDIVRFGPEFGCRIALEAMADRIEGEARP